jgi:hypothetical protein
MTAPATEVARKTLRQLRESTGTLFAQNLTRNKVTCNTDKVTFSLEPAGREDSIKIVPKECLDVPGFQKLWMKKRIAVSDDPDMEDKIFYLGSGQVEMPVGRVAVMGNDGKMTYVEPTIEQPSNRRDFTMKVDAHGQPIVRRCVIGNEAVFQTDGDVRAGQPPLCAVHQAESHRVVSTPQPDGTWSHQVVQ